MDSKYFPLSSFSCFLLILLFSFVSSDISKDREKCGNVLIGISTCLPYVTEDAKEKTPSMECCSGLKPVIQSNKECLCILVKDRNDPGLGFKINATLALGLPDKCHVPVNISECPELLQLPANSPDAKVFQDFASSHKASNSSTTPPTGQAKGPSADDKSDGSGKKRWLKREMVLVLLITVTMHVLAGFLV